MSSFQFRKIYLFLRLEYAFRYIDTQETRGGLSGKLLASNSEIHRWNHVLDFAPGFPTGLLFWPWSNHLTFFSYIFAFLLKTFICWAETEFVCLFLFFLYSCTILTKTFSWECVDRSWNFMQKYLPVIKKTKSVPNLEMSAHGNIYSQPVKFSSVLLGFEL